jgi:formylglycine-generating enzyme required for sulfatase activity
MNKLVKRLAATVVAAGAFVAVAEDKAPQTVKDKLIVPDSVVEFTMVKLPAGKVTIKDADGKGREVDIKSIWIGQTEVTWPEYDVYWLGLDFPANDRKDMLNKAVKEKSRPSRPFEPPYRGWGQDKWPAGSIWDTEAKKYCAWLSEKTGKKYRLPTEAEWEYACRAGGPPVKPDAKAIKEVAHFLDNSDDQTHEVAKLKPNAWGLYDMLGNVGEWVIRLDGTTALAGGSYRDEAEDVSSERREPYNPKTWQTKDPQEPKGKSWLSSAPHAGFRIVRED